MAELLEDLKLLIRTRHAIVSIQTLEEEFATRQVCEAARDMGWVAMEWTISDGLRRTIPTPGDTLGNTQALVGALRYMRDNTQPNIYILKDALRYVSDPAVERLLRDTAMEYTQRLADGLPHRRLRGAARLAAAAGGALRDFAARRQGDRAARHADGLPAHPPEAGGRGDDRRTSSASSWPTCAA